jgi:predicted MPP superfamily phosphohydrolase
MTSRPMTPQANDRPGASSMPPRPSRQHHPAERPRVRYTRSWFGLGAAGAALGLFGLQRYGWPALAGVGAAGLASAAYIALHEPARPQLTRVTLRLAGLPPELDVLRFGKISDSHLGMPHSARNLAWAVAQMRRERPELLTFTGDFVSHRVAIPTLGGLLQGLSAPLGAFAVPGNHDYWEGLPEVQAQLARHGITLLINQHRRLRWKGADLWLAGVDDLWDGQPDLATALRGVPRADCTLLLAHCPDVADEAARLGVAAQLSGHTHGGHLRLPLLGPLVLPRYGWNYPMGQYQVGRMALYVSRGLSGPSFRLLCRPEATIFTLRCAA